MSSWIFRLVVGGIVCSAVGLWAAPASREPANLDLLKQEIGRYVEAGTYREDIAAVAAEATAWLERRAAQGGKRLTVVFDLDETLISPDDSQTSPLTTVKTPHRLAWEV